MVWIRDKGPSFEGKVWEDTHAPTMEKEQNARNFLLRLYKVKRNSAVQNKRKACHKSQPVKSKEDGKKNQYAITDNQFAYPRIY